MKTTTRLVATVHAVPNRSWTWAKRCEIRVHAEDINAAGRGYRERCEWVEGDFDARYHGPRSRLGERLRALREEGIRVPLLGDEDLG